VNIDILISVTEPLVSNQVGHRSKYTTGIHPGSKKKIEGWKWGEFFWPTYSRLSEYSYIPSIFDANVPVSKYYFQSGYGHGDDIKLEKIQVTEKGVQKEWLPVVSSGKYFVLNKEWYLFSDEYVSELLNPTNNIHSLGLKPKDLNPILIRNYKRDIVNSELLVNKELTYKITLDANGNINDPSEGHFTLDPLAVAIKINANDATNTPETSSFTVGEETDLLQLPVFPVISTNANSNHWSLDPDLGTLKRIDPENDGLSGTSLSVEYTPGMLVIYEPSFSSGTIRADKANTNPLHVGTNQGFVQITTEILDPFKIKLTTDLPDSGASSSNLDSYTIYLGNNVGKLIATVKNKSDTLLEGVPVNFDWEGQLPFGYGDYTDDITSITNSDGSAYVFYKSPKTINDIGTYIHEDDVILANNRAYIDIEGFDVTDLNSISIYEIRYDDEFYGLDDPSANHYSSYFTDEEITDSTATESYEKKYRSFLNSELHEDDALPRTIDITISNTDNRGQKRMLFEEEWNDDGSFIDPNTGLRTDGSATIAYSPLRPEEAVQNQDGSFRLRYTEDIIDHFFPRYKFFIVSNKKIKARAWVRNAAGEKIFSNEIVINITLPDSINGVYYTQALNSLPDIYKQGLLRQASVMGNTAPASNNDLNPIKYSGTDDPSVLTTPAPSSQAIVADDANEAYIPLGFRIKDAGITVAGLLDQVTFLTKENENE